MALTMSTRYIPQLRTAIIDELQSPAVEGARGRGIPEGRILFKDVLDVYKRQGHASRTLL